MSNLNNMRVTAQRSLRPGPADIVVIAVLGVGVAALGIAIMSKGMLLGAAAMLGYAAYGAYRRYTDRKATP